jgi:hypothetical protein
MKEYKNSFLFSACPDILEYCEGSEINDKIKKEKCHNRNNSKIKYQDRRLI